jgi:hypothetical protein
MNNSALALLLAAAGTGLMSGTTVQTVPVQTGRNVSAALGQMPMTLAQLGDKHDCAGKNSCKGQGGCKSSDMGCKGKNSCKGKGGCKAM